MADPVLKFLSNEAGEKEGLGDAGIETFRDTPYVSCAREAGQNSRDAVNQLPVGMTFDIRRLEHHEFPSHPELTEAIEACRAEVSQDRETAFFANAVEIINKPSIPVLEIADSNTTGLTGPPDDHGTPFHSLVKSSGVTVKSDAAAGGSFGIGKNASFAVSDLHTVFYSSVYENPETRDEAFAAQGKVKLVSHTGSEGQLRRATGYWGDPDGFRAVTERSLVPDWMGRDVVGTSIFCMGFRESEDWAERITYSLVSNFFCAVHRQEMVFAVNDGEISVNHNTLEHLLEREDVRRAAQNTGHLADLEFARQLYRCLVSENAEEEVLELGSGLGRIRVRILVAEGMPRRIGFIRNGMLITDNLRHFGQPLARFPGSRDFVALVEPEDTGAGVLLKQLENPAHDGFSAERIPDPARRSKATAAMSRLGREIRETIRGATSVRHEGAVVLDELGRYFAEPGQAEAEPDSAAEDDPEKYTYSSHRRRRQRPRAPTPAGGQEGGHSGTGTGSGEENGGGTGTGFGTGSGGRGTRGVRDTVRLRDVRNRIRTGDSGMPVSRELYFTPGKGGPIEITVQATGVNVADRLGVVGTDTGDTGSGLLLIDVAEGERCSVTVSFDEPYDGPIELLAVEGAGAEAQA
ncbi:MAG: hypothetical protein OXQ89_09955 [Rhodospirillaceae bacterium]|nr:hypothetical protein [Rhodospirillaceae bacterium]MDD9998054.1 hypothetical protein [Rhodospirillaceae bacterium]MDE0359839.1 hypothetical protein [Rhodospirillaceae bacterium]